MWPAVLRLKHAAAGAFDVALNSLTSPGMVAATLSCLALGGRMAEISKRDIWSPARVAQERPDMRYQLVAIDFLPVEVTHLPLMSGVHEPSHWRNGCSL